MDSPIELRAPPEPAALAAALADLPGVFALVDGVGDGWSADRRRSFVSADPDGSSDALDPFDPGDPAARAASTAAPDVASWLPRWVGVVPYEACRVRLERTAWVGVDDRPPASMSSILWRRYPAVIVVDHDAGTVVAHGCAPAARRLARHVEDRLGASGPPPPELRVRAPERGEVHVERVRAALELIRAGDLYQASLARRLALDLDGALDGPRFAALARALMGAAPSRFGGMLAWPEAHVVSTSPELLLDARSGARGGGGRFASLRTEPIKGTRPRSGDAAIDAERARDLDLDPKERAELAMVVDVERNDLGRVAIPGSVVVEAPQVVVAGRVLHRIAGVRATARPELDGDAVLRSIVPSGSVTGAPKVRAMEVIARLESARRGLYTGAFGVCTHDGSMRLSIPIRTAVFPTGVATGEWLVGGGIVEASDPERELVETRWKSRQIAQLAGMADDDLEPM